MDIPIGVDVFCLDGRFGQSTHVLLNPISQDVTHVVVRDHEGFESHSQMVPFRQILETTPNSIRLRCGKESVLNMPVFIKVRYLENALFDPDAAQRRSLFQSGGAWLTDYPESYLFWPYVIPENEHEFLLTEEEQIPVGEMAVHRSADVWATDCRIGHVDEFVVDSNSTHITHIVLKKGHLLGKKDVVLPVSAIAHMAEDEVRLNLSKLEIASLPQVPVRCFHKVAH